MNPDLEAARAKIEKIAKWVEELHCSRWKDDEDMCVKSNCILFRQIADDIRRRLWED